MLPPFTVVWSLGSIVSVTHILLVDEQVQDAIVEECLAAKKGEIGDLATERRQRSGPSKDH